jgi:prefoldin subunit 5
MSISRILERDINNAKNEVESVIDQLIEIISEQEKEIEDLSNKIQDLRETLSTLE